MTDYRVIYRYEPYEKHYHYEVCEVFYDENNKPYAVSQVYTNEKTFETLQAEFVRMNEAFQKPVLALDDDGVITEMEGKPNDQ